MKNVLIFLNIVFLVACKPGKKFEFRETLSKVEIVTYPFSPSTDNKDTNLIDLQKSVKYNILIFKKYKEKIILSTNEIAELENIILNSSESKTESSVDCYNPRHCIYFYNSKNEIIDYLEICFECNKTQTSEKSNMFISSETSFNELKTFFKKSGIKQDLETF